MKEKALASVVSLFALVAVFKPGKGYTLITNILEVYLSSLFTEKTTERFMDYFRQKIKDYLDYKNNHGAEEFERFFEAEIDANCYILSREVLPDHRMLALIYLIEYIPYMSGRTSFYLAGESSRLIHSIAEKLEIPRDDFEDAMAFSTENYQKVSAHNPLYLISDNSDLQIEGVKVDCKENLEGQLIFIRIVSLDTILLKVSGQAYFEINDRKLYKRRTYILEPGTVIHAGENQHFYYNDVARALTPAEQLQPLVLEAENISFRFPNGVYGIQPMSFSCSSGEIVAIMGGSGSGKTTLMNLLIGARKPYSGSIRVNNTEVFDHPDIVKGHIGYVPQDDALIEELTAFQNLYFIASLAHKDLDRPQREQLVNEVMEELNLTKIRRLKVGNPLDKVISGGQRKRLNIAIELIRNPGILFLDEPTSGLSSSDSENIMKILKKTAASGRLVIMNIHQPSSDIYKMFDKLLFIDKGGYAVYYGPAMQVPSYLKKALRLADAGENECQTCGNLNPDDIFHLIESRNIATQERKETRRIFSPERWHRRFLRHLEQSPPKEARPIEKLQPQPVQTPGRLRQFVLYLQRNLLTKFSNYSELLLALLLPPVLALLLSVFSRYIAPFNESYSYHLNDNIPPFIFMSVIVAMFVGIMSGSGEIIKDRKTLNRESFLELSYGSFVFSKLSYLIVLSALQMLTYVWVSKWILEVPSGNTQAWVLLWSTTVAASVMGLVLSSIFKTMASVYLAIPFVLIPQILFSGAVIDFNKINPIFASDKYVPLISEPMLSRWVYEGVSVSLYLESAYTRELYRTEKGINESGYTRNFLIPEMEKHFFGQSWSTTRVLSTDSADFDLIRDGIRQIEALNDTSYGALYAGGVIKGEDFSNFLGERRQELLKENNRHQMYKDSLIEAMGYDKYRLLQESTNQKLQQVVVDETNVEKVRVADQKFIRKMAPVYHIPEHRWGRAHLYAPAKRVGSWTLNTHSFNTLVIWLMSLLFLVLVLLRKPRI
ncbi:ATP-binding cassette domain-containing protein [Geofilum rhodophaeum]|uniref:ATP-binding cassette domain-containing protein n=1 Tax=Geofilum rhodophaeum TaxID=1965019 RepID=UPI000B525BDD|nr:ATP-binding cassette domain-containing protein [Geofilum rhodophaeum]